MSPADPSAQLSAVKSREASLEAMIDALTKQRQATHQIGDAECKLIDIELAASVPRSRHCELLQQKRDATHRLAAARMLLLTTEIEQDTRALHQVRVMARQMESPLFMADGGLAPQ